MANRAGASLAVFDTTVSGNGHDGALAGGEVESRLVLGNVTIVNNNGGGLSTAAASPTPRRTETTAGAQRNR